MNISKLSSEKLRNMLFTNDDMELLDAIADELAWREEEDRDTREEDAYAGASDRIQIMQDFHNYELGI